MVLLFFMYLFLICFFFFFSSRRRHTRSKRDWSSDVCSSDLAQMRRNVALAGSIAAIVDVPVAEPPHYSLEVAGLIGGRRLLSDDVAALEAKIGRASCRERV